MTRVGLPLSESACLVRATTNVTVPMPGNRIQQAGTGSGAAEEGDDGGQGNRPVSCFGFRGICPCMQSSQPGASQNVRSWNRTAHGEGAGPELAGCQTPLSSRGLSVSLGPHGAGAGPSLCERPPECLG